MKEKLKALAARYRLLAKCVAAAAYLTGYQDIEQELDTFVDPKKRNDRRYIRRLMMDIYFSELFYQISVKEYFWYQFESKSDKERRTYIGETEKNSLCEKIGDANSRMTLADKFACYTYFRDLYGRDVIEIASEEDRTVFADFLAKHYEGIVKPIGQSGGTGVYRIKGGKENTDQCFQTILANGPCVVEQRIEQTQEMAQFHPQSVNTVRVATFRDHNEIDILFSIFRAGIGDAIVDNTAQGGVFASIDVATGKIQSDGYLDSGSFCQTHPDSGCVFYGFQVPRWQDLLDLVLEAARAFPQYSYVSWDFALTDSGWVMVEANSRGEFAGYQVFLGGIRELFMNKFRVHQEKEEVRV